MAREHKMTAWEAGSDLCACADYLGEREEEAAKAGFTEHAKLLRDARIRIANFFNRNHSKSHEFGLGPAKARSP
jgi:hypothetical protein